MRGDGVERDIDEAISWLDKAAGKNHINAQYELAKIYLTGKSGIEKDVVKSAKWLHAPALHGNDDAQYKLGMLYLNGEGVYKNVSVAEDWLNKAAKHNNVYALLEDRKSVV